MPLPIVGWHQLIPGPNKRSKRATHPTSPELRIHGWHPNPIGATHQVLPHRSQTGPPNIPLPIVGWHQLIPSPNKRSKRAAHPTRPEPQIHGWHRLAGELFLYLGIGCDLMCHSPCDNSEQPDEIWGATLPGCDSDQPGWARGSNPRLWDRSKLGTARP